ncbi:MAG TPA: nuclear transport factor 2 family protein [Pirellulales bacterium]|jgi:hypothetical protein|nr:nuclear transport factor 2 family protein [Pirellulales bacterium]
MNNVVAEIQQLEAQLRTAELGPDPRFFEDVLDDQAVLLNDQGDPALMKAKVVSAHQPGNGPKFTRVEMSNLQIIDHGTAAVVTCAGRFETAAAAFDLKFMRVWVKKGDRWVIVAGTVSKSA